MPGWAETLGSNSRAGVLPALSADAEQVAARFPLAASLAARAVGTAGLHLLRCRPEESDWRDGLIGFLELHVIGALPETEQGREQGKAVLHCLQDGRHEKVPSKLDYMGKRPKLRALCVCGIV